MSGHDTPDREKKLVRVAQLGCPSLLPTRSEELAEPISSATEAICVAAQSKDGLAREQAEALIMGGM